MAVGFDDSVIIKTAYLNKIESTVQDYTVFENENFFPAADPSVTPGGTTINWLIDYDTTNNGGLMTSYDDAAPTPDDLTRIEAYQTKDYFQHAALVYDILINQVEMNRDGNKVPGVTYKGTALENAAKLMAADWASAAAADLLALIDSAGNFSDAALLRATYNLASAEETTVGTLALTDMDSVVSSLMTKEYGRARREDLFWMMDSTNQRRVAALSGDRAYSEISIPSAAGSSVDAGMAHRVMGYDNIPILIEDSLGSSDILLLRKGTIQVFDHWKPAMKELAVAAWQQSDLIGMGKNIVVKNPRWNAKLSGITG
jgi:hypothetical protein